MTNEATRLAEELRDACAKVRKKSFPLADLIPLMQRSADALATLAQPAVSADARDAARYRWLRENACNYSDGYDGPQLAMRTHGPDWHAEIDAAIDAAMASQEKPHD